MIIYNIFFSQGLSRSGYTEHEMYDFEPDLDPEGCFPHQMSVTNGNERLGCVEQEETSHIHH